MTNKKSSFQVLSLTEAAATQVKNILTKSDGAIGLRVGVKKGGCAGMEYTLDLVHEPNSNDDRVDMYGATVFIEPSATLFLLGTEMHYEVTKLRSGFVFDNPNQISACGCGESISLVPATLPKI